ncbi:MAG: hypothetical protein M3322_13560, partial [Actinomycetota bacterium]|nr:hypothetical protein [Actinomycetota bacterium]
MSVAAPPRRLEARGTPAPPAPERLATVLPQVTVFVCLAFLYAWQAWLQRSPWLYYDELNYARLARSIAETGWTGDLGGEFSSQTLYAFVTAPAWLLDDVRHAYEAAKYIGVLFMTATVFPAYLLARTVAPPRPALFAAAASVCIPALSYSSLLMQETLAYPYATLSLFLMVTALSTPTRARVAAAVAASLVAPLVRVELVVLPLAFAAAALVVLWVRRDRRYLPGASRLLHWGVAALVASVLALAAHLVAVRVSDQWAVASDSPREIAGYALWA